ncbi:membrane protein insertase YidC [Cellulomonas sp. KRMCY2]|uniref:membrane protein insertase YidC n=1 Tax=Cellulomonas sp. KRMCY2 TaxID=1304865 RepID=UPI00045EAFB6
MIDNILWPLKVAVAWLMVQFHSVLTTLGLPSESGVTWALSIVGLVVVIRILLIPLFVKQIKASRGMQLLAPEMQVIQKKYKGKTDPASREAMSRETMELYRKHGTNPFSSCLPILAQSPIFFALFRVLYSLGDVAAGTYQGGARDSIGPLTQELAAQANAATIFGAPISETFLGSTDMQVKIVTVVLIVMMSLTTFTTQRQLTQKNMPASALQGPMAQQQKMLLYILPLVFAISGVNFPIGVLIYWSTTNLWTMGQQFYVIRRNPTPGSEAERQLKERRARKAAARGIVLEEERPATDEKVHGQRQQPKRKERAKGTAAPGATPAHGAAGTTGHPAATNPAGAKPATKTPGAKPAGTKPAGAKPAGTKQAGAKPAGVKPAGAASAGAKAPGTTAGTKAAGSKAAGPKKAGVKPAGAKPAGAEPAASGTRADAPVVEPDASGVPSTPSRDTGMKARIAKAGGVAPTAAGTTSTKRPGTGTSAARRAAAAATSSESTAAPAPSDDSGTEGHGADGTGASRASEN